MEMMDTGTVEGAKKSRSGLRGVEAGLVRNGRRNAFGTVE
jgi:hypothetical protein